MGQHLPHHAHLETDATGWTDSWLTLSLVAAVVSFTAIIINDLIEDSDIWHCPQLGPSAL